MPDRQPSAHVRAARRLRRTRAALRDAWLILRDSGPWLLALALVWLGLGLLVWRYDQPADTPLSLSAALYIAFKQLFFEPQDLPRATWLQVLFFVTPAIGLALVARGAFNAALLIFDKRNRRDAWQAALASTYRDHVIVVGLGKIGYRVVGQLLDVGHDVIAIERNRSSEFVDLVQARGVPIITGDARQPDVLLAAGLLHARSLVGVINDDLTNLDVALTARNQRPDLRIVLRVFNDALAHKLQSAFNIHTAFSTSALAAPTFAAAALNRNVANALYLNAKLLTTQQLTVAPGGALDQRLVGTIEQTYDLSVLYRRNDRGEDLRPRSDYRLSGGDTIVITGTLANLETIAELNQPGARPHVPDAMRLEPVAHPSQERNRIIVCGLGKVGYRVAGQLRAVGQDVIAIEREQSSYGGTFIEQLKADGVPVIRGDARRLDVLLKAGLEQAHAVVCVVNDDLTNLDIALTAREHCPDVRIVLRMFNDALAHKLQSAFNIKTAFSTSALAAPTLAAAALSRNVTNALTVGGRLLTMQQLRIVAGSGLAGQRVDTIEQRYDLSVLYRRNQHGDDLRPHPDERISADDEILVVGTLASLERVAALNRAA